MTALAKTTAKKACHRRGPLESLTAHSRVNSASGRLNKGHPKNNTNSAVLDAEGAPSRKAATTKAAFATASASESLTPGIANRPNAVTFPRNGTCMSQPDYPPSRCTAARPESKAADP